MLITNENTRVFYVYTHDHTHVLGEALVDRVVLEKAHDKEYQGEKTKRRNSKEQYENKKKERRVDEGASVLKKTVSIARGVRVRLGGEWEELAVEKEVILCAGRGVCVVVRCVVCCVCCVNLCQFEHLVCYPAPFPAPFRD